MNGFLPRVRGAAVAAALTLFLSTPAVAEEPEGPPAPTTPGNPERPFEAEQAPIVLSREISVPLTGLTQRNRDDVAGELEALAEDLGLIISQDTPDLQKSAIAFSLPKHGELSLSDLETALEPTGVQINFDALEIPGGSRLVLFGPSDDGSADRLRRALERADLFQSFRIDTDEDLDEITVVTDVTSPVEYSTLLKTLDGIGTGYDLVDFFWVSIPAPKA